MNLSSIHSGYKMFQLSILRLLMIISVFSISGHHENLSIGLPYADTIELIDYKKHDASFQLHDLSSGSTSISDNTFFLTFTYNKKWLLEQHNIESLLIYKTFHCSFSCTSIPSVIKPTKVLPDDDDVSLSYSIG